MPADRSRVQIKKPGNIFMLRAYLLLTGRDYTASPYCVSNILLQTHEVGLWGAIYRD